jgi:hypothetical protein
MSVRVHVTGASRSERESTEAARLSISALRKFTRITIISQLRPIYYFNDF